MQFNNPELEIDSLPKAEDCELTAIDPRYYTVITYSQVVLWIALFILSILIIILNEELRSWSAAGWILAMFGICCFSHFRVSYLSYRNKAYAVRQHDIMYQTGWLKKSLHVIPYSRIQHCSIDAGVFERNLGIAKLRIYTAGGDDSDLAIPGLEPGEAAKIRELIIGRNINHDNS